MTVVAAILALGVVLGANDFAKIYQDPNSDIWWFVVQDARAYSPDRCRMQVQLKGSLGERTEQLIALDYSLLETTDLRFVNPVSRVSDEFCKSLRGKEYIAFIWAVEPELRDASAGGFQTTRESLFAVDDSGRATIPVFQLPIIPRPPRSERCGRTDALFPKEALEYYRRVATGGIADNGGYGAVSSLEDACTVKGVEEIASLWFASTEAICSIIRGCSGVRFSKCECCVRISFVARLVLYDRHSRDEARVERFPAEQKPRRCDDLEFYEWAAAACGALPPDWLADLRLATTDCHPGGQVPADFLRRPNRVRK